MSGPYKISKYSPGTAQQGRWSGRLKWVFAALTVVLLISSGARAESTRRIALTYDDAPRGDSAMSGDDRAALLISGLEAAGVEQAAIFVVTSRIDSPARLARIQSYAEAGHVIANHTHTHPWLRHTTAEAYLANQK